MFGKVKKIFFNSVFGILYVSFFAQLIYILVWTSNDLIVMFHYLGALSLEWLVLIAARYLSKRSSGNANNGGYNPNRRR